MENNTVYLPLSRQRAIRVSSGCNVLAHLNGDYKTCQISKWKLATVLIQLSLVLDQQFAFEYFYNCSDHKAITKITMSIFGLTCMNVGQVEKTSPCLIVGCLRRDGCTPIEHRPVALRYTEVHLYLNSFNAEAAFVRTTRMQIFLKTI